jgi:hypothetical protein
VIALSSLERRPNELNTTTTFIALLLALPRLPDRRWPVKVALVRPRKEHLMRRFWSLLFVAIILIAAGSVPCLGQDFKPYPGSKVDAKASGEASAAAPGKESQVYTTTDALDKVNAFYKGLYKEITMQSSGPKLPSGEQVRWVFFAIDGGPSLAQSKYWMKIQRPYVGGADGKDIRDITVIQTVRTK